MLYDSLSIHGPRVENQDSYHVQHFKGGTFACVADGVGGNTGGSIASQLVVHEAFEAIKKGVEISLELFLSIDRSLKQAGFENNLLEGMASTLSACVIANDKLFIGHCGDSRILLLRNNGIKQLTPDHTEVEKLVKAGILNKEDALTYPRKNVLESALGAKKELLYFGGIFDLQKGDRVLLTTDGVHGVYSKKELRDISLFSSEPKDFILNMFNSDLEGRITDNATLVVLENS